MNDFINHPDNTSFYKYFSLMLCLCIYKYFDIAPNVENNVNVMCVFLMSFFIKCFLTL